MATTEVPNLLKALSRALQGEFDEAAKAELGATLNEAPAEAEVVGDLNDHPQILALLVFVHQLEKLDEQVEAEHVRCHEIEQDGERSSHHLNLHAQGQALESMLEIVRPLFWRIADQQFGTEDSESAVCKGFQFVKLVRAPVRFFVLRLGLPGMSHDASIPPSGSELPSGQGLWERIFGSRRK